jgi:cation transport regulator ChaB
MPYATERDLPLSVSAHLPLHAQEIYRAAFNTPGKNMLTGAKGAKK